LEEIRIQFISEEAMFERKEISVYDLLLDITNYRIGKQESQKAAFDAIIEEQGKKLIELAEDIIKNKLSPFDLPMVTPTNEIKTKFVMIEGNRRLTAIKLVLEPDLAEGTTVYQSFKKLNKSHVNELPKKLLCVVAKSKQDGLIWIQRKHDKGLKGAGTEEWSAIAKERADAEQGKPTPTKDLLDFVAENAQLDESVKKALAGSKFPITNLARLIDTPYVRNILGIKKEEGKLTSNADPKWLLNIATDIVVAIAKEEFEGEAFNVSKIDNVEQRKDFINKIVKKCPRPDGEVESWAIGSDQGLASNTSSPQPINTKSAPQRKHTPPTTGRSTFIPKSYKLQLPSGKINNIYHEMKTLDIEKYPNAISILFRVFIEFSVEYFIKENNISSVDANAKLVRKLEAVIKYLKEKSIMTDKELKPIDIAIASPNSPLSINTLNAYVHNPNFNPTPSDLKLTWESLQPFIEKIWEPAVKNA
jgi:hypothetical protein